MANSQPPPHITITEEQAEEFMQSLRKTLKDMTITQKQDVRLVVKKRNAVAVSYDMKNRPFLGYTAGYNKPDIRTAMPPRDPVLSIIRQWLLIRRKVGPKGGRVFITSNRAFTIPDEEPIILCTWIWPKGDIVDEVLSLLDESLYW